MDDNKFLPKLSQNFLEALDDDEYCDVTIETGSDPNMKQFQAHMVILSYRSPYFRKVLTNEINNNDDETSIYIKLSNILPETFQIVLTYIYSGGLSLNEHEVPDVIKIMIASSELELQELVVFLQSFLINNKANWMEQNFDFICQLSFESDNFLELQKYCTDFISEKPDIIFKSLNYSSIPKKLMIEVIQYSNLNVSDIQVWNYVVNWGLSQNQGLPSDLTSYSKDDFKALKKTLHDFIPFIKFRYLTSKEFSNKVLPFRKLLPKKLYMDLLKEFLENDYRPALKSEEVSHSFPDSSHTKNIDSDTFDSRISNTFNSRISSTFGSRISNLSDSRISNTLDSKSSSINDLKISNTSDSKSSSVNDPKVSKISSAFNSRISSIFDSRVSKTKSIDSTSITNAKMVTIIDSKKSYPIMTDKTNDLKMTDSIDSKINTSFIDSNIILNIHRDLISEWIEKSNIEDKITSPYEFKLLFRASRDGFSTKKFHKICENITHTVSVINVEGINEIFGGFNPITWKSDRSAGVTKDSFIFSFKNKNDANKYTLSRVVNEREAINNGASHGPSFGNEDLHTYRSYLRGDLSVYCNIYKKISYERPIRDDHGYVGRVKELEIFQIVPLNQ